jgi:hypothetical protein
MTGIYSLAGTSGGTAITTALTNEVITVGVASDGSSQAFISGLDWMAAVTLFANFTYGSGGTTCIVIVQTCLDGVNWIDIARFDFATASVAKRCNLSGLTPVAVGAVAALAAEGVLDGILGDRLRAKVTSTGTYAGNTSISVRAAVR